MAKALGRFAGRVHVDTLIRVGGAALAICRHRRLGLVVEGLKAALDDGVGQPGLHPIHQAFASQLVEDVLLAQTFLGLLLQTVAHQVVVQEGVRYDVDAGLRLALVDAAQYHDLGQRMRQVDDILQEYGGPRQLVVRALAARILVDDAQFGMSLALLVLAIGATLEIGYRLRGLHVLWKSSTSILSTRDFSFQIIKVFLML